MRNLQELVNDCISQLSGPHAEDAWHSLVEFGPAALSHLIAAFNATSVPHVRSQLVRVVSEWRSSEAMPFLAGLLREPGTELWKEALDGLVKTGGPASLQALDSVQRVSPPDRRAWLREAIEQIIDATRPG